METYIGDEGFQLIESFQLAEDRSNKYASLIDKLEAYCTARTNLIMERYKFHNTKQKDGEPITEFVTRLKLCATTCEYGNEDISKI